MVERIPIAMTTASISVRRPSLPSTSHDISGLEGQPFGQLNLLDRNAAYFSIAVEDAAHADAAIHFHVKVHELLSFDRRERHFGELLEHEELHMLRAALAGSDGAIHSGGAAADHRHAARKVVGLRIAEKVSHLDSQRFVLDAELDGFPKADGHADRVVTLGEQTLGIRDVRIRGGVDRTQ